MLDQNKTHANWILIGQIFGKKTKLNQRLIIDRPNIAIEIQFYLLNALIIIQILFF